MTGTGPAWFPAATDDNDVAVVDTERLEVRARIRVGEMPWGIARGR